MSGLRFNSSKIGSLLLVQAALIGISSVLMLLLGSVQALSWFLGGAISIVSNSYLAFKLISRRSADPNRVLGMMYAGEFGKIVASQRVLRVLTPLDNSPDPNVRAILGPRKEFIHKAPAPHSDAPDTGEASGSRDRADQTAHGKG